MRLRIIGISTICLVWAGFAVPCQGEVYSLSEIYSLVLEKSESIRIAQEQVQYSGQEKNKSWSLLLPTITLSGEYFRTPEKRGVSAIGSPRLQPEESYEMRVTLEQPLFTGGRSFYSVRSAKKEMLVAHRDLNLSSEEILLHTANLFYGVLKSGKDVEAQQRNVERLLEHRRLSELRFEVGEVTETVLLRAEAELAGARADLVASENNLAVRKRELRILTELPEAFNIMEPPLPEILEAGVSELIARAFHSRDDVLRSELQQAIAKDELAIVRGEFLPTVTLEGAFYKQWQEPESDFLIEDSWFIGGRVELPIFEGGLRLAERAQAQSQLRQAKLETSRLKKAVDLDVTRSFLNLEAVSRVLIARQDQQRFAAENYEMVSRQFTFGLATHIDLLDANQTLIEVDRDIITATYDRHLAILDVQRSVGVFLEKVLKGQRTSM